MFFADKRVTSIAIDPCENKLYYTDKFKCSVNMVKLKTSERKLLIHTGKAYTLGLALDLIER